ncbi:MAG: hypothetical protein QM817_23905 [Archangium sp.]
MKRVLVVLVVVLAAAFGVFVAKHYEPRRERTEGWRARWDALPLDTETVWSLQKTRREVVLQYFVESTDELAHCNAEYFRGTESVSTQLELLISVDGGVARLMYVVGEQKPELPAGLVACVERALERTKPVAHPGLAGTNDARWRMGLSFLFHPPLELPPTHWWDRFVPDAWKSGGNSSIHVG